LGGIWRLA